jgi:UDP-N-acetyl-2-amino-2-deoxyglucuronate dehydrogenase
MCASRPLGFGIVGLGMIADYHAQALAQVEGARLLGVAGRSAEKARSFAQKYGIPFSTGSVDQLANRPEIDVVCIATPSGAHLEPALAAIRAGKHVVVEKPIEITMERAQAMLDAADRAGVKVAPIFQARFGDGARTVKAALVAGRFGRLVLTSAYVKWHRKPEYYRDSWHGTLALDGGGALMNQGIHAVDLLQWFSGMPEDVFGWTTRRVHEAIEVEDTVSASLRFPGGGLGAIEASTALYPGLKRRIEICGADGSAVMEDDQIVHWEFRAAEPGDEAIRAAKADERMRSGSGAPNQISIEGHRRQFRDTIDALRSNRPLAIEGREAANAVALIQGIYASAERGVPVRLSL